MSFPLRRHFVVFMNRKMSSFILIFSFSGYSRDIYSLNPVYCLSEMTTTLRLDDEKFSSPGQSSSSLDILSSTNKLRSRIHHSQMSTSLNRNSPITESKKVRNYFDLTGYQSSVLQLACAYQSILKNYANIEQAALNYRASAGESILIFSSHSD